MNFNMTAHNANSYENRNAATPDTPPENVHCIVYDTQIVAVTLPYNTPRALTIRHAAANRGTAYCVAMAYLSHRCMALLRA